MRVYTSLTLLTLLGVSTAVPQPKLPSVRKPGWRPNTRRQESPTDSTDAWASPPSTEADKSNIWKSLSNDEAAGVIGFLHDRTELNLTAVDDSGPWDNTIMVVDLLPPNKTDALAYLDSDGDAPQRWAIASLLIGATEEPYAQDLVVGPLPVSGDTVYFPYTFGTHAPEAKIRVYDMDSSKKLLVGAALSIKDIISDLTNVTIETDEDFEDNFSLWGIDPLWHEEDENGEKRVIYWAGTWRNNPRVEADNSEILWNAGTLLPQGIYFQADITGRDKSKWFIKGILYGDEYYKSTDDFRAAWEKPDFVKYTPNQPGNWLGTDMTGEPLPLETKAPPMGVQPGGQRFKIDEENKYIEWMDFSFYLTFTRDTGMRLFDIKYKGERVIYELGLQEATAHYAGNDPVQSGTSYMDSYYGLGSLGVNQVPGFDMPGYAYCMNTTFHAAELSKSHPCGISIFESDQDHPIQRHSTDYYNSVTKNIALTVRAVSTVGNYDYTFDYNLFLDGSIETVVRASGYIQTAYYAQNDEYGYKIHDGLSGSMHDHAMTFKADFDVLGTKNTMVKHVIEPVEMKYKWSNQTRNTMHMVRKEITNEDDGKMNWSANGQEQVIIVNKDETNKYGEPRGWKMMPSRGGAGMHLTITNSSNLLNSAGFATHQYYVSKRKDSELRAASAWNDYDTANPLVNFDKFFDGESIDQEDIVVWYNLGMHHVPHTGDLPNTVSTTAQAGMFFTPHNYLRSDPSRQSTQQIRLDIEDDKVTGVHTFGSEPASGEVNFAQVAWDPWTYSGDIAVRKFPYDPQNPFEDTESI